MNHCLYCNNEFVKINNTHKYCSFKCRFWSKVDKKNADECWEWKANLSVDGYGRISESPFKTMSAHRNVWYLEKGNIPENLNVCHSCDNPPCVNPRHLWLGSQKDNVKDMINKSRGFIPKGVQCHLSKITDKEVREIRESIETTKILMKKYNLSQGQIDGIRRKAYWKHVV